MDQPYMSMQIINLIQLNYKKHIDKKLEQMKAKAGGGKRRR